MEVFWNAYQDRVIDIALDIAGYLLAGGLWLLVYSSWQARRTRPAPETSTAAEPASPILASTPTAREGRRTLEFVSLTNRGSRSPETAPEPSGRRGRNRAEVFAVARRMLAEGASGAAVKSELPISDGELALLDAKKDD